MSTTIGLVFDEQPEPQGPSTDKTFDKMKKAELEAYAAERGIDITAAKTNANIVELLLAAEEQRAAAETP